MNCQLGSITLTARDGRVSNLEHAYIRGSKIRFLILPDMLKNAPMFKRVEASKTGGRGRGLGLGRGRAVRGRGMFDSILHLFFYFFPLAFSTFFYSSPYLAGMVCLSQLTLRMFLSMYSPPTSLISLSLPLPLYLRLSYVPAWIPLI